MPLGPGKYDELCEYVRQQAGVIGIQAQAAIVIVIGGNLGSGFSVKADPVTTIHLPDILNTVAAQIKELHRRGEL